MKFHFNLTVLYMYWIYLKNITIRFVTFIEATIKLVATGTSKISAMYPKSSVKDPDQAESGPFGSEG
jgi:hypothetical protein